MEGHTGVGQKIEDVWAAGESYEPYVGRWSRLVAHSFLEWLDVPAGSQWVDVGCGTGALTHTIVQTASPGKVTGIDAAEGFISFVREQIKDNRATFHVGDARSLPLGTASCDAAVSGLMLNFVPQPQQAVNEMARITRPGGVVAAYVWDYADRMQFMRQFWNAVTAFDKKAVDLDEGRRFPVCSPGPLIDLFVDAGLTDVEVQPIDIWTVFKYFDDYWLPFLGGQGPAPSYVASLSEENRTILRERIRASLPYALDGSIPLMARAWAVRGSRL